MLETTTDVAELNTVIDDAGNLRSPANLTVQKEIRAAIRKLQSDHTSLGALSYSTSGTAVEQLPSNPVPDSSEVLLQADPNNTGRVYVGNADTQAVGISPDGTATLDVMNTDAIHIQTPSAGDSVGVLFEDA